MKKLSIIAMAAAVMLLCACNGTSLASSTSALSGILNGATVGNVLTSVLGIDNVSAKQLVGNWTYLQPGCAFMSKDLLAKAGGEVAAAKIKQQLSSSYATVGINSANTKATFTNDGKFTIELAGKTFNGTYTYNESESKITMKTLLLTLNCYTKRNSNGIALLFEGSKLLTILRTAAALSGQKDLETLGNLSKSYDGLRVGFDMK